jgi:Ca2+-binding EF-hand superfamily protein
MSSVSISRVLTVLALLLVASLFAAPAEAKFQKASKKSETGDSNTAGEDEKGPLKDSATKEKHYAADGAHNEKFDQEQFLGPDEAKEFNNLSPDESKKRLAKLVPRIDKDSNGSITLDELKGHIQFMQKRYLENDIERTWKDLPEKDGKVAWKDYIDAIYGVQASEDDGKNDDDRSLSKWVKRDNGRWKNADKDADGQLNKEEYGCFVHPESCAHMQDNVVKETISDIDKDGDGMIDVEEYIADMYHPDDKEARDGEEPDWVKAERENFAERRDVDHDGKLGVEEMREWIMPTDFDHVHAEARHLIHLADDDKDGTLSEKEILEHHDAFVGSQATDYGEQLQRHDPAEL